MIVTPLTATAKSTRPFAARIILVTPQIDPADRRLGVRAPTVIGSGLAAALIGLCVVLLAPLLFVDVPPLLDYPNHLARAVRARLASARPVWRVSTPRIGRSSRTWRLTWPGRR